jgi:alpha-L-rhamnosidase
MGLGDERTWQNLLTYYENLGEFDTGIFGTELLLRLLFERGEGELAVKLLTSKKVHSFAEMRRRGATTLFELFQPEGKDEWYSKNHHFWGHISAWFIKCLAGIRLNPHENNVNELTVAPAFPSALDHVTAYHDAPAGRIEVAWRREGDAILLDLQIPEGVTATAELPRGYRFECGESVAAVKSGSYRIAK